ncbi:MAG: hypothetical protein KG003_08155 [Bacteroidetes bacterium]|nr:hypothetical protein [Bacteroidota bacterium]
MKFVIDRKELINGKDSIIYGWIYVDDKIDYSLIYNEQGDIEFLAKKDSLGYAKGGYSLSFQNNILIQMKYLDSIGLLQGPLFIYNKRGKLKHLLIYKDDQLYKIIYTRCAKCLNRDTLFINAKPLIREQ